MTSLPVNFLFSQGNLQDYVDCRRRFQLRHLEKLAWPAVRNEPVIEHEQAMFQGQSFHRLVNGYFLGIPEDRLTDVARTSGILGWWLNFLGFISNHSDLNDSRKQTEATYQIDIGNHRFIARYDLIVHSQKDLLIYDWKTSKVRPKRGYLGGRLQTRIYPYLLAEHASEAVDPDQLTLVYWFSEFPGESIIFQYSREKMHQDKKYLSSLISEIEKLSNNDFNKTDCQVHCNFCVYRSLCERGNEAGESLDNESAYDVKADEMLQVQFDFESIPEIEY